MIFCADPQAATDSVQISAAPPFCSISCLVCSAGLADPPSPVREAPISATITLAPAAAIIRAISRPMPPPAPVTTATFPSIIPGIVLLLDAIRAEPRRICPTCEPRRISWRTDGHHALLGLARIRQRIAHPVHPAALPGGAKHPPDRRLQAVMGVRDHQLHPLQTPPC